MKKRISLDMQSLDIKLLRLLDALHTTRSVTRTAERLDLSQPTISIGLARLRKMLGDPLFVRTSEGMQPTPRVDALMPAVRQVLDGLQQLASVTSQFEASTTDRRFRIFMTDASHVTLLPCLFAHVRTLAPNVELEAANLGPDMAMALQSGYGDLALGLIPGLENGFYQQALFDQDWICLCSKSLSSIGERFTLKDYFAQDHVGIVSGTGSQLLEEALRKTGKQRRVKLALPGFLGLSAILSTSDLVATLPRHIGETLAQAAGLRALACPVKVEGFTVKQYWHTRFHQDPANRWLRGVCAELFLNTNR